MRKNNNLKFLLSVILCTFTFASCIMDCKTSLLIKNCTADTLLIDLSSKDTLANWDGWSEPLIDSTSLKEMYGDNWAFYNAIPGRMAQPGFVRNVDPYVIRLYDTCYIYAIKWNIAKQYSMDEIRKKKLYDRRAVTKKDFVDHWYEYK